MPEEFLLEECGNDGLKMDDEASIEKLAKKFRVSASAMRYRLANLT